MTPKQFKVQAISAFDQIVADVYERYQAELKQNESLDFDDLIMMTIQLFDEHKDVLADYQDKFQYIHVDEYQDTNEAQYQLVNTLAKRIKIFVLLVMPTRVFMVGVVPTCKTSLI